MHYLANENTKDVQENLVQGKTEEVRVQIELSVLFLYFLTCKNLLCF